MKRINGTGSIIKLSGNRRRPYRARITTGYNEANPIYQYLTDEHGESYFSDRAIAELLLANYNLQKGNINIQKSNYTFEQVFKEYSEKYFPTKEEEELEKVQHIKTKGKLGRSVASNLRGAYKKCTPLYNKKYKSLKKSDFDEIIFNTTGCGTVINSLANLFKKLDNYALEQDIIIKGYADLIKITTDMYIPTQEEGIPYSYEEIQNLWDSSECIEKDITICTIYTGTRIEELLFTKTEDVFLKEGYFVGGLKTNNGKRRIIPIHHEIVPIIEKYYKKNINNEFLFTINNKKIDYNSQFLKLYKNLMWRLQMDHKTHDGRRTLRSELERVGANKVCIDKILGQKSGNIGDDVYTKKSIEELIETIELINYTAKKDKKLTYIFAK